MNYATFMTMYYSTKKLLHNLCRKLFASNFAFYDEIEEFASCAELCY